MPTSPSRRLSSAAEMIDHVADLLSDFAGIVHDNERRWRVFRARSSRSWRSKRLDSRLARAGLRPHAVTEIGDRIAKRARAPGRSRRVESNRSGTPGRKHVERPLERRDVPLRRVGAAAHRPHLAAAVDVGEPAAP